MSVKWTKELLAECRNENGVVLGMISEAARMALRENREHAERFMSDGWMGRPSDESWHVDSKHYAYRLSPSYVPPELEEKPFVDVPVEYQDEVSAYVYKSKADGCTYSIVIAAGEKNFAGYVYEDGMVTASPRRDNFDCGIALAPVSVRFWKGA